MNSWIAPHKTVGNESVLDKCISGDALEKGVTPNFSQYFQKTLKNSLFKEMAPFEKRISGDNLVPKKYQILKI